MSRTDVYLTPSCLDRPAAPVQLSQFVGRVLRIFVMITVKYAFETCLTIADVCRLLFRRMIASI